MRSRQPVVVGRDNPREDLKTVLEEGQKRLEANISIIIFPKPPAASSSTPKSSTRWGSSWLNAATCRWSLRPEDRRLGPGRRLKDFGPIRPEKTVHIHFGEPMRVEGSGKQDTMLWWSSLKRTWLSGDSEAKTVGQIMVRSIANGFELLHQTVQNRLW